MGGSIGDFVEWTVSVDAGNYPVSFRYHNLFKTNEGNRPLQLWVNGVMIESKLDFWYTSYPDYFPRNYRYSALVNVDLNQGTNTIKLVSKLRLLILFCLAPESHVLSTLTFFSFSLFSVNDQNGGPNIVRYVCVYIMLLCSNEVSLTNYCSKT